MAAPQHPPCRGHRVSLTLLAVLLALGAPVSALGQGVAAAAPLAVARMNCAQALALLSATAMRSAPDPATLRPASHPGADAILRHLTDVALSSPRCPAAFGARGLVKWELEGTGWEPRDAPGQRPGVPWNLDAIYDLALAGKEGGDAGAISATIATELLLPEIPPLPFLVREVGPSLLNAFNSPSAIPDTLRQFQRGRLAAWLWAPETADSAFAAYAAAGGAPDRAALELARVRLATGRAGADSLYFTAAESPDTAIARELRRDIAWIADSSELASFDSTTPGTRATWLRDFWEQRDLEALRPRGSRLAEHYRRVGFARANFRLMVMDRKYELNELWVNRTAPFDDRGLIYIRHGEPDDTASAVRAGACPNVSWLYRRSAGNMVFHFVARENPDDWRLVETLANVSGEAGATTRVRRAGDTRSCAVIDDLLESRAALDPIYAKLVASPSRQNWERELALTTRSRKVGTTTDSDPLRFPTLLKAAWRNYALLGSAPGKGRVLVLTSIPAEALVPIVDDPPGYGFRTHIVARAAGRTVELDSVRRIRTSHELNPDQMLSFTTEVPLEAGRWDFGAVMRQPSDSAGQSFRSSSLVVPDIGDTTLQMSDIILGAQHGGLPWSAPDGTFMLSSTGAYPRGEPVLTFYELAGIRQGDTLTTDVTFAREGSKKHSILTFKEPASGRVQRIRREMDTSGLDDGRYTMTITVRVGGDAQRSVSRETSVFIEKP